MLELSSHIATGESSKVQAPVEPTNQEIIDQQII